MCVGGSLVLVGNRVIDVYSTGMENIMGLTAIVVNRPIPFGFPFKYLVGFFSIIYEG